MTNRRNDILRFWHQTFYPRRVNYLKCNLRAACVSVPLVLFDYLILRFTAGEAQIGLGITFSLLAALGAYVQYLAIFGPRLVEKQEKRLREEAYNRRDREVADGILAHNNAVKEGIKRDKAISEFLRNRGWLWPGYNPEGISTTMFLNKAGGLVKMPISEFESFVQAMEDSSNYLELPQAILLTRSGRTEPVVGSDFWLTEGPYNVVKDRRARVMHISRQADQDIDGHVAEILQTICQSKTVREHAQAYRLKTAANWVGQTKSRRGRTDKDMKALRLFLESDSLAPFALDHKPAFNIEPAEVTHVA